MSRTLLKYSHLTQVTALVTTLAAGLLSLGVTTAQADQVINDDLIVSNSLCVGFDCVNNESFGFDTIRLKENNTRIKFQDTSASSSFPSVDWQLTANDSSNGGANKFSIDDIDNGRTPFTITAGARANAIFVSSAGRVGFGTATPSVDLHVRQGNTPTLRLEQDGSSGFAAQTWDVAGNESGFFVRDVTNGSQLPFRIIPGADSSSIAIGANNNVGIGAGTSPDAALHVERNDGTAQVLVKDTSAAAGNLTMLLLENAGGRPRFQMTGAGNAGQTGDWSISAGDTFVVQDRISSINTMVIEQSGNMTITGALTQNSDKNNKMAIVPVAHDEILAKVAALPISAWTYKNDAERGIRHIGPMAQDFYAAFETGAGPTGISTIDTGGVALAAIKALSEENNAQRDLIAQLSSRLEALEGQISK